MKKVIETIYGGVNSSVGDLLVNRLLPGQSFKAVGPIVFLDHVYPVTIEDGTTSIPTGRFAHPHRGIATFSYVLDGQLSHYDSKGDHDVIGAGGVIKLRPKSSFTLQAKANLECAAFVPAYEVMINGNLTGNSTIIIFGRHGNDMVFENPHIKCVDIVLFGGEPYTEEIVSQGPFVMNSHAEIATAYREFFEGKYGTIAYTNGKVG